MIDNKNPLITIITINLNNGFHLLRTINSLLPFRSDPDVEFIFIDGASVDNSLDVAKLFYYDTEILSEPDNGIYHAMNKGLFRARGLYGLWLNSGDEIIPANFIEVKRALKNTKAALACFGLVAIPVEKNTPARYWRPQPYLLPHYVVHHQAAFFRLEQVKMLGGYDESYRISGDQDLVMKLFFCGLTIHSYDIYCSKFYEGGISSTAARSLEDLKIQRKYGILPVWKYWWKRLRMSNEPFFGYIKRALIGGN